MSDSDSSRQREADAFSLDRKDGLDTQGHTVPTAKKSTSISPGVRRAEVLMDQYLSWYLRVLLFVTIFIVLYVYSIDGTVRGYLQSYATASYAELPLMATINVIRAVVLAAAQPCYARLLDRFGRIEIFVTAILFYVVGTIIELQAWDINRFAGGAVLYSIGYTGVIVMIQIILADFSNLNWRLACLFIPAMPFIINTWVLGDIVDSIITTHLWSWGIALWAYVFPLLCIPFLGCLVHMWWLARKTDEWRVIQQETRRRKWTSWRDNILIDLFWELDVLGLLFIICVFGFILVPFTLAGGTQLKWQRGSTIAPLVIGFVLIPFFVLWEARFARFPIVPYKLIRDRGVWLALVVAMFVNWVWYMPNDFMYTILMVAMNQLIKAATRITQLYSFVLVIVGPLLGLVIVYFRRTKGFIMFGVVCWIIAMGILVHFRGDNNGTDFRMFVNGVIGAECLLGFGAGFYTYTTQVSIATCTNHEYMAVIISLYLASYNIGSALGASVSGAIYTNLLYDRMVEELSKAGLDASLATQAYGLPFEFIVSYTWGTPERVAIVLAYAHVQRILCIVGLVLCFPLLLDTFFLRDHQLDSVQLLELDHKLGVVDEAHGGNVVLNDYDNDVVMTRLKRMLRRNRAPQPGAGPEAAAI